MKVKIIIFFVFIFLLDYTMAGVLAANETEIGHNDLFTPKNIQFSFDYKVKDELNEELNQLSKLISVNSGAIAPLIDYDSFFLRHKLVIEKFLKFSNVSLIENTNNDVEATLTVNIKSNIFGGSYKVQESINIVALTGAYVSYKILFENIGFKYYDELNQISGKAPKIEADPSISIEELKVTYAKKDLEKAYSKLFLPRLGRLLFQIYDTTPFENALADRLKDLSNQNINSQIRLRPKLTVGGNAFVNRTTHQDLLDMDISIIIPLIKIALNNSNKKIELLAEEYLQKIAIQNECYAFDQLMVFLKKRISEESLEIIDDKNLKLFLVEAMKSQKSDLILSSSLAIIGFDEVSFFPQLIEVLKSDDILLTIPIANLITKFSTYYYKNNNRVPYTGEFYNNYNTWIKWWKSNKKRLLKMNCYKLK